MKERTLGTRSRSQVRGREIQRDLQAIRETRECLDEMTPALLEHLHVLTEDPLEADGFPPSTRGGSGGRGSPDSSSTESAALLAFPDREHDAEGNVLRDWHMEPDPDTGRLIKVWNRPTIVDQVSSSAQEVLDALHSARRLLRDAWRLVEVLRHTADSWKSEDPGTTPCDLCDLTALASGLCRRCYGAWHDHGRPDRVAWKHWKLGVRSNHGPADGEYNQRDLLVPDCPPPSPGQTARRGPHAPKKRPAAA